MIGVHFLNINKMIKQGSIIEFPLEHNLGFGYAKLILSPENIPEYAQTDVLRIYDFFSKEPFKEDIQIFSTIDYFVNPMIIFGSFRMRGQGKAKILGQLPLKPIEEKIPHFMQGLQIDFFKEQKLEELEGWFVVKDFNVNAYIKATYQNVKHLGEWHHSQPAYIIPFVTMMYLKKQGLNILDYYDLNDKNFWIKEIYNRVQHTPFYADIPKEIRERAIE